MGSFWRGPPSREQKMLLHPADILSTCGQPSTTSPISSDQSPVFRYPLVPLLDFILRVGGSVRAKIGKIADAREYQEVIYQKLPCAGSASSKLFDR